MILADHLSIDTDTEADGSVEKGAAAATTANGTAPERKPAHLHMSRYQAFGIHFAISALIFFALAYVILNVWYPDFFFELDGGWEGLRIIIGVDLVLGPLLTLIVYRAGKPGLATDLILIGIFQAICLTGGMWVVASERPQVYAYVDGHFYSMSADGFAEAGRPAPELPARFGPAPHRVQVQLPPDADAAGAIRADAFRSNTPMRVLAEHYAPFAMDTAKLNEAYPLTSLRKRDADTGDLDRFLAEHGGSAEDYAFFPLGTRYRYIFSAYRRDDLGWAGLLYTPGPL